MSYSALTMHDVTELRAGDRLLWHGREFDGSRTIAITREVEFLGLTKCGGLRVRVARGGSMKFRRTTVQANNCSKIAQVNS